MAKAGATQRIAWLALDLFGGQWHRQNQLLFPYADPLFPDTFVVYTLKPIAGGDIAFSRHIVTKTEGEYTCDCAAHRYRRYQTDFIDKHIAAVLSASELYPEPAAIYKQWKLHND